ncbi:ParB/RepB/Spo0J family partition protein [Candidatus Microgenomates bacterium]|nr:ParB/RepB/Spo0J family partition protein [Candidatus Microgenomates bacterium]
MPDEIFQLLVDQLQTNPLQPRGVITPESLVDLIDSVREHGVLEPLVVAKTPAGYQIIAGERRWRAARLAGLAVVPCVIRETSPQGMLEMALVENVQRVDLNPIDRAKGFERLMNEFGLHNTQIAQRIGKSTSYISNSLRLLSLPDALKDGLLQGLITEGHARALAAIEDPSLMIQAYKIVLREAASVRRTEELSRRMKTQMGQAPSTPATPIVNESFDKMEEDFKEMLGGKDKADVKLRRSRVQTRLIIILKGDVDATEPVLNKILHGISRNGESKTRESDNEEKVVKEVQAA